MIRNGWMDGWILPHISVQPIYILTMDFAKGRLHAVVKVPSYS